MKIKASNISNAGKDTFHSVPDFLAPPTWFLILIGKPLRLCGFAVPPWIANFAKKLKHEKPMQSFAVFCNLLKSSAKKVGQPKRLLTPCAVPISNLSFPLNPGYWALLNWYGKFREKTLVKNFTLLQFQRASDPQGLTTGRCPGKIN
jgi:hypothetical protein